MGGVMGGVMGRVRVSATSTDHSHTWSVAKEET